ncbi:MAG: hypothetical protein KAR87_03995 [Candidatus Aenigmarchaeota archaeon]|nr:hypothetical protein [Candidatus Aenigmarchaeota archaeon]
MKTKKLIEKDTNEEKLDVPKLTNLLESFNKEYFRLELLECYRVEEEWDSFQKFLKGETILENKNIKRYFERVHRYSKEGKKTIRLHVVPTKLSDYLKFEITIGYIPLAKAGELVYLMSEKNYNEIVNQIEFKPIDYWLFDDKYIIEMLYDSEGRFLEEREVLDINKINSYVELKQKLLEKAISLDVWLRDNPNYNL